MLRYIHSVGVSTFPRFRSARPRAREIRSVGQRLQKLLCLQHPGIFFCLLCLLFIYYLFLFLLCLFLYSFFLVGKLLFYLYFHFWKKFQLKWSAMSRKRNKEISQLLYLKYFVLSCFDFFRWFSSSICWHKFIFVT